MTLLSAFTGAATIVSLSVIPATAQTNVPDGIDGPAMATAEIVAGILSYTRWSNAEGPVRLCIAGQSALTTRLVDRALVGGRRLVVSRRTVASLPGEGCDAVFLAGLPLTEQQRIARAAQDMPIVTMTDADPACGSGMMACLRRAAGGMSFDLNLDAVSRSSVRIDPRVLILANRRSDRR